MNKFLFAMACIALICTFASAHLCGPIPKNNYVSLEKYSVEIVKIRDCNYVFWENGYGSDMEHYAGCVNPDHAEFREDAVKGMRLMWEDAE